MITVCLHGGLREYGRRFDLHVASPAEAVRALCHQLPGFRARVESGHFQVRFNGQDQNTETLPDTLAGTAEGTLHIVPRVAGAGKFGQIILGAALVALSFVPGMQWAGAGAMTLFGATANATLFLMGASMVLGGVAQLLTRPPKLDMGDAGQKASRNSAVGNLDNAGVQGRSVPLAYGEIFTGSVVVSQGVTSRRLANANDPVLTNPQASDITLNLNKSFISGQAAIAPNGQPYATDFSHDSVRARNYTVKVQQQG